MAARICLPRREGGGRSAFGALKRYVFRYFMRASLRRSSSVRVLQNKQFRCSPVRFGGPSPPPFRPGRLIFISFLDYVLEGSSLALLGLDFIGHV